MTADSETPESMVANIGFNVTDLQDALNKAMIARTGGRSVESASVTLALNEAAVPLACAALCSTSSRKDFMDTVSGMICNIFYLMADLERQGMLNGHGLIKQEPTSGQSSEVH